MAQFQNIQHSQPNQLTSQPSLMQPASCQYQLEQLDSKPQFPRNISVSQNQAGGGTTTLEMSQNDMNNVGNIMVSLDSGMNGSQSQPPQFVAPLPHSEVAPFLMNPSKRAETFVIEEVKLMLKEIEARKHILLSISPSTNRLKRRAWEEVAISMANRWPHAPRRTADQVKKKWENLVSKTKRKVRAGHITPDLDWNETNTAVMQFLTQHSPPIRLRYSFMAPYLAKFENSPHAQPPPPAPISSSANSFNSPTPNGSYRNSSSNFLETFNNPTSNSQTSLAMPPPPTPSQQQQHPNLSMQNALKDEPQSPMISESDRTMTQSFQNPGSADNIQFPKPHSDSAGSGERTPENCPGRHSGTPNHLNSAPNLFNTTGPLNDSFLPPFPFNPSLVHFGLPPSSSINEPFGAYFSREMQKELGDQYRMEHQMRMEILQLQKEAWTIQVELMNRQRNCSLQNNTKLLSKDPNEILNQSPQLTNRRNSTNQGGFVHSCTEELGQLEGSGCVSETEPIVPMEDDSMNTY